MCWLFDRGLPLLLHIFAPFFLPFSNLILCLFLTLTLDKCNTTFAQCDEFMPKTFSTYRWDRIKWSSVWTSKQMFLVTVLPHLIAFLQNWMHPSSFEFKLIVTKHLKMNGDFCSKFDIIQAFWMLGLLLYFSMIWFETRTREINCIFNEKTLLNPP